MEYLIRLAIQLAAAVAALVGFTAVHDPAPPTPPTTICAPADDGIVWQYYTDDDFGCDVIAGQTLGLTGTPSATECADMGGEFLPYGPDPDGDGTPEEAPYDGYGDCKGVDF